MIRKIFVKILLFIFVFLNFSTAEEIKKVGKFKDWETVVYINGVNGLRNVRGIL